MPLPSSGTISLNNVNVELNSPSGTNISLNQSSVRSLFGKASGIISLSDGWGKSNIFPFTISTPQTNLDLYSASLAAGWNGTSKVEATIAPGVEVTSTSTGSYALSIPNSFPNGVNLINNGKIIGKGGSGESGNSIGVTLVTRGGISASGNSTGTPVQAVTPGGPGLFVDSPTSITNNGIIAGGGGGGGGGQSGSVYYGADYVGVGSGGGGGAGSGSGGPVGVATPSSGYLVSFFYGGAGSPGTSTTGGSGGPYGGFWASRSGFVTIGDGGAGGALGSGGSISPTNEVSYYSGTANAAFVTSYPQTSGAGGNAVAGNSKVTWVTPGTIAGSLV